jgi:hypothetical protein
MPGAPPNPQAAAALAALMALQQQQSPGPPPPLMARGQYNLAPNVLANLPMPPMRLPLPQQSMGERNRFLEQNLPPGQNTYSGDESLRQAMAAIAAAAEARKNGQDPAAASAAQFDPAAQQAAAQTDIRQMNTSKEAPQIKSVWDITPEMLPYLLPEMQNQVVDFWTQIKDDPALAEKLHKDGYDWGAGDLDSINQNLGIRWNMTPDQLAEDNAKRGGDVTNAATNAFLQTLGSPLEALDQGRQWNAGRAGEDAYNYWTGGDQSKIGDVLSFVGSHATLPGTERTLRTHFYKWMRDPQNAPLIRNAYETGYTGSSGEHFTGGEAVWELFAGTQSHKARFVNDLFYDPATFAPAVTKVGEVVKGVGAAAQVASEAEGASAAARVGLQGLGKALSGLGAAATLPDAVLNRVADDAVGGVASVAKSGVGALAEATSGVPVLGQVSRFGQHLAEIDARTKSEDAVKRRLRAVIFKHSGEEVPTDVVPNVTEGAVIQGPPATPPWYREAPFGPQPQPGSEQAANLATPALPPPTLGPPAPRVPDAIPVAAPAPGVPLTREEAQRFAAEQQARTAREQADRDALYRTTGGSPATVPNTFPESGVAQPYTPGADVGVRDFTEPPPPEPPPVRVVQRPGYSYVGDANEYRVAEKGAREKKTFWLEEQRADGKGYTQVRRYPTKQEAIDEAVSRIRGDSVPETGAVQTPLQSPLEIAPDGTITPSPTEATPGITEVTPPTNGTAPTESGNGATFRVPTRKAVLDPNGPEVTPDGRRFRWATAEEAAPTPTDATAGTPRRRTYLSPKAEGQRVQDVAFRMSEQHPDRFQAFVDEYKPAVDRKLAADDALKARYGERYSPEKAAISAVQDVEHVVDEALPAFHRIFGDIADVPQPTYQYERPGRGTTVKKGSFRKEPTEYLIERAVFSEKPESAAGALAVLRTRAGNGEDFLNDLIPRIEAARQRFVEMDLPTPTAKATPGEGPIGFFADLAKWAATGERPRDAAPPLTEPHPQSFVPPEVQNVLDESVNHPDYQGTVASVFETLGKETKADQEELHALIKQGVTPEKPARGKASGGRLKTKTVKRFLPGDKIPITVKEPVGRAKPGQRMTELIDKYKRVGNLETADPVMLARGRLEQITREEIDPRSARKPGLLADLFSALVFRSYRHELLANPALSWAYTGRNIIGNEAMTATGLHGQDIPIRRGLNVRQQLNIARHPEDSIAHETLDEAFGAGSADTLLGTVADVGSALDRQGPGVRTPTRDLLAKLKLPEYVAKAYDWKKGIDHTIERAMKLGGAFLPMFKAFLNEQIDPIATFASEFAARQDVAIDAATLSDTLWSARGPNGGLSRHSVYDAVFRMAGEGGANEATARRIADRASRNWQHTLIQTFERAVDQTNRFFPDRRMTNADKYASYVFMFHMWPTRAAKFFLEESIRDPRLPLWWYRAHEGLNHLAEEDDYPSSAQGLIKLAQGPLGWMIYGDPAAAFMLNQLMPDKPDYGDPKGETSLGHALKWIQSKTGLSITPFFDALLNVSGVYGNDFLPDPIPNRTIRLVGTALDALLTATGHHMGSPVYQQTMSNLRGFVSGHLGMDVPAVDQAGRRGDPISSMVLEQNPDLAKRLTDPTTQDDAMIELGKIMENEDDPRYVAAEKAVARGGLFSALASSFSPIGLKLKNETREAIKDAGNAVGFDTPWAQMTPEQQAAVTASGAIGATPEALVAEGEQGKYHAIGGEPGQKLLKTWNLLAYGTMDDLNASGLNGVFDPTGKVINFYTLTHMSDQERRALADAWASNVGSGKTIPYLQGEQKTFKDEHPVYKGYADFQKLAGTFDDKGGIPAFREGLMKANAPYRTYIGRLKPEVKNDPKKFDQASISMKAYLATKGITSSVSEGDLPDPGSDWANTEFLLTALGGGNGTGTSNTKKAYDLKTPEGMLANLTDKLAAYERDMTAYNQAAANVSNGIGYDQLPPQSQEVAQHRLDAQGVTKPGTPEVVGAYLMWKVAQPQGADTSPQAYISWLVAMENAAKPAA